MKNMNWKKIIEFFAITSFMFVIGVGAYSYVNLGVFNNIKNAIEVFQGLGWFVGSFTLATIFTAYLVVIADTKFIYRFLAIPAWLGFAFTLSVALDQFLGYAYPSLPPRAELLSYRIIRDAETGQRLVEAWMYLSKEHRTRTYRFPFNLNHEEGLYQAMRRKSRGEKIEIELKKGEKDKRRTYDYTMHKITHKGLPSKSEHDGKMVTGSANQEPDLMGQSQRGDPIIIQMPGGAQIEIEPGTTFRITSEGELEIGLPTKSFDQQDNEHGIRSVDENVGGMGSGPM